MWSKVYEITVYRLSLSHQLWCVAGTLLSAVSAKGIEQQRRPWGAQQQRAAAWRSAAK